MDLALIFIFSAFLSVINFFSEHYFRFIEKFHSMLVSFSAGVLTTVIFIELLPLLAENYTGELKTMFMFIFLGVAVFHVFEKYVYQHANKTEHMKKDLTYLHAAGFAVNHFVLGLAIYFSFSAELKGIGLLLLFPVLLHTLSSSLVLNQIDKELGNNLVLEIIISVSPLIGTFVGYVFGGATTFSFNLFAFVLGIMIYVAFRDMMPEKKEGKWIFFLIGAAIIAVFSLLK